MNLEHDFCLKHYCRVSGPQPAPSEAPLCVMGVRFALDGGGDPECEPATVLIVPNPAKHLVPHLGPYDDCVHCAIAVLIGEVTS